MKVTLECGHSFETAMQVKVGEISWCGECGAFSRIVNVERTGTTMQNKQIRFIDSHYNTLFSVRDGSNILITYPNGQQVVRPVRWAGDETHFYVGNNCYHYHQFASQMRAIGATYAPASPETEPKEYLQA